MEPNYREPPASAQGYGLGSPVRTTAEAVRATPSLQQIEDRFCQLTERMARSAAVAGELGDRLGGARPSPIQKDPGRGGEGPLLIRLDRDLDEACRILDILEANLDRINTSL